MTTSHERVDELTHLLPKYFKSCTTIGVGRSQYWDEIKLLLSNALPVYASYILDQCFYFSSIALGHMSTTAMAASTLGTMTVTLTGFAPVHGAANALDALLPSAWTSNHPELVGLWSQRMFVVTILILVPIITSWWFIEPVLLALKQDPEVSHLTALYLRCFSVGMPADAFNTIAWRYFQSQGLFQVPTYIGLIVAPLTLLLTYLLAWGPSFCRLGFIGPPIAVAVGYYATAISYIIYGVYFLPQTAWHPFSPRSFSKLGVVTKLAMAGIVQLASEWFTWEVVGLSASFLSPTELAAQSALYITASLAQVSMSSLSCATAIRIGNLMGESKSHNEHRIRVCQTVSFLLSLGLAAVSSALIVLFRHHIKYIFTREPDVLEVLEVVLPMVAIFHIADGLLICTGGILRASNRLITSALLNVIGSLFVGLPLGYWLAFPMSLGLLGLWEGFTVGFSICGLAGVYFCITTSWDHEVKMVLARHKAGAEHVHTIT